MNSRFCNVYLHKVDRILIAYYTDGLIFAKEYVRLGKDRYSSVLPGPTT